MAETHFFYLPSASPCTEISWQPAIDVYRGRQVWLVKCDLAGVRRDEIEVTASESGLTISGVRRDWCLTEGHRAYSMEIAYNRFSRTIKLPCELEKASIQVDYRDGMLLITIRDYP